ncbi:PEP-CTERM sorting domain-containing protein [Simiduia curdlanivorans]|uniref:PEP-CTERM sorting domain-containing protein n=1 Tax=Simiduia curdlanivorans TaxID=1492769 RepID=A0ABV8V2E3_9GAMM|nr:PEP-CTERM sorting domain-containing protein [Simiduia curdlanivorans]MDN3637325.1 PEP-CTERM sorting domain-containing protein [Simiduia curdlanivorans]
MKSLIKSIAAVIFASMSLSASASLLDVWSGWTVMTVTNGDTDTLNENYVNPGYGGQAFDAEYLLYKYDASTGTLSFGLQTGFDILDGHYRTDGKDYYNGDLALSFDGDKSTYEYAIDFGNLTKTYHNGVNSSYNPQNIGQDAAGLYAVDTWNNDIAFDRSSPFAMSSGAFLTGGLMNEGSGSGADLATSYYNMFSFNVGALGLSSSFLNMDAHWTMSCGNDVIEAHAEVDVPEPAPFALLGLGLLGLAIARKRLSK